jgi:hypothetical protein
MLQPQSTAFAAFHCVAPIVLSALNKFSYNLKILFLSLVFFSLASGLYFHESGMIHMKSSAAHNTVAFCMVATGQPV